MTDIDIDGPFYTVGQLAEMLGCSVRSIYRWEDSGAIPPAMRIDRGEVSVRVYTRSQVEQIRKQVRARITLSAAISRPIPVKRRMRRPESLSKPRRRVSSKRKSGDDAEVMELDPEWRHMFISALHTAHAEGCIALTITTQSGETRIFQKISESTPKTRADEE